jgi:hypothetical protein
MPSGWAISLDGLLMLPVPVGKELGYEIFRRWKIHVLWLDLMY